MFDLITGFNVFTFSIWGIVPAAANYREVRRTLRLAETEGFEPSVREYPYGGLANRWFQPLTHVSAAACDGRL